MKEKSTLLERITKHYLLSRDFNGYCPDDKELSLHRETIKELVQENLISINWGDPHQNPFIKAFKPHPIEKQLEWLENLNIQEEAEDGSMYMIAKCCLYPSTRHLENNISKELFIDKPFNRMLALGKPQLEPLYFDSEVLFSYLNNPKYKLDMDNISGTLYSLDGAGVYNDIFLEHIGFGINQDLENFERCVAMFPCDLMRLDSVNQQLWEKFLHANQEEYFLHPDYAEGVCGNFSAKGSIFKALLLEINIINEMSRIIYGVKLYKNNYEEIVPENFMYILIPSKRQFLNFANTLSNMLIDNINHKFFEKLKLELTIKGIKPNGEEFSKNKSKITLLNEWLDEKVKFQDSTDKEKMISSFKYLYRLRSSGPAHNEFHDEIEKIYFRKQRDLIMKEYTAIRTLRLILSNHRLVKDVKVPEWLYKGDICSY